MLFQCGQPEMMSSVIVLSMRGGSQPAVRLLCSPSKQHLWAQNHYNGNKHLKMDSLKEPRAGCLADARGLSCWNSEKWLMEWRWREKAGQVHKGKEYFSSSQFSPFCLFLPYPIWMKLCFFNIYIYLFIFGCIGSSLLHVALSSCGEQGPLLATVCGCLIAMVPLAAELRLQSAGSAVVAHGASCSAACGILPDQGSNLCPLRWQADSQPLHYQGSPEIMFLKLVMVVFPSLSHLLLT